MSDPVLKTLTRLRNDAIERGMHDLALAYGWSIMRIIAEVLRKQSEELR
jgi:hypothetical protein